MHYEKFDRTSARHMLRHYARDMKTKEAHIDESLSSENYELCKNLGYISMQKYYEKRLSEVKVHKRSDVKTLCSWVVSLPLSIKKDSSEERLFFQEAYNFLSKRYGVENIISATVHKDEPSSRPHMHFSFIPVVYDKNKDIFKVSAKECVTKVDLKRIHTDMSKHMEKTFGRDVGIINGATAGGNLTIQELKAKELEGRILTAQEVREQVVKKTLLCKLTDEVILNIDDYMNLKQTAELAEKLQKDIDNQRKKTAKKLSELADEKDMLRRKELELNHKMSIVDNMRIQQKEAFYFVLDKLNVSADIADKYIQEYEKLTDIDKMINEAKRSVTKNQQVCARESRNHDRSR